MLDGLTGDLTSMIDVFRNNYDASLFLSVFNSNAVNLIVRISISLSTIVAAIAIIHQIYTRTFHNKSAYANIIFRIFIVAMFLGFYNFFITTTLHFVDDFVDIILDNGLTSEKTFNVLVGKTIKDKELYESELSKAYGEKNIYIDEPEEEKKSLFNFSFKLPDLSISQIMLKISFFLAKASVFIVNTFRNVVLSIMVIVGPLFIVTFINPLFDEYGKGWLMSFINVLSWPIWLSIVLLIQDVLLKNMIAQDAVTEQMKIFSFNIVFVMVSLKVMSFLPDLKSGRGGAISAMESMATGALMGAAYKGATAMKGGAKGVTHTAGKIAGKIGHAAAPHLGRVAGRVLSDAGKATLDTGKAALGATKYLTGYDQWKDSAINSLKTATGYDAIKQAFSKDRVSSR